MHLQRVPLALVCTLGLTGPALAGAQTPSSTAAVPSIGTGAASEQVGGTKMHGTIADPDGAVIPGATITLTPAKGSATTVKSTSDGSYTVNVSPGLYSLVVTMQGFASYAVQNLRVPSIPSFTVDAKLTVGETTQVINVEASSLTLSVDQDSNASSTVISGKDLEALSDDPDELSSELSALAGPAAGPNGGQIYVDGFTGGQLPPKSSIREIRINQNPFSAEYDRLGYGRVEVFTKPGTDKLHGSFQINGNASQFNSGNPITTVPIPGYHTLFMFGSLTGPLSKRASYSVGGSHRDIEDDSFTNAQILAPSPTSTVLCAPGQAGCSVTGFQQSTYTPQIRTDISPRFDFALGEKNVLTARFQYVQNDLQNQGVGNLTFASAASNSSATSAELQLSDTQTISSKLINETRFEYERERTSTTALSNAPFVIVTGEFQSGGSPSQNSSDHQDHIEVQNYTSLQLAKNFIRFGGRLRTNREAINTQANTNGQFIYSGLRYLGTGVDNSYETGTPSQVSLTRILVPNVTYTLADLGLYLETDWKAKPNLTVSYGLRFETQNHISDRADLAPRISFAYGVGNGKGAPKTVVRGGFGLFYDRFTANNILTTLRENPNNTVENVYTLASVPGSCTPAAIATCISGTAANGLSSFISAANLRAPYTVQFAGGADQQISRSSTVSVNYLHSQGVHEFATANVGYPTTPNPVFAPGQTAPANYEFFSEGVFRQDQLIVNSRVQTSRRVSLFGYYQLGFAKGDTSGASSQLSTPYDIAADYGRTTSDLRHRFFLAGSISLPHFVQVSPFVIGQSGTPYNVTIGNDVNHDTFFNDRPYAVSGVAANGNTVKAIGGCGTFASTAVVAGAGVAPINACTGPGLFTFNFRATKTFGFGERRSRTGGDANGQGGGGGGGGRGGPGGGGGGGRGGPGGGFFGGGGTSTGQRYNVAFGVQVQNLFGNTDYGLPNGTLSSRFFGQSTQLAGGPFTTNAAIRRLSLQASFSF